MEGAEASNATAGEGLMGELAGLEFHLLRAGRLVERLSAHLQVEDGGVGEGGGEVVEDQVKGWGGGEGRTAMP